MSVSGNGLYTDGRPRWARIFVWASATAAAFLLAPAAAFSVSYPRILRAVRTAAMSGNAAVVSGSWLVAQDGAIFAYGDAHFYGYTAKSP